MKNHSFQAIYSTKRGQNGRFCNFRTFDAPKYINSSENKNSKIYSDNFFCIPKTYLNANFQDIWSKNEKALGILKVSFFQNSGQNAVLLPVFNLNFRIAPNREHVQKIWADASYQKI